MFKSLVDKIGKALNNLTHRGVITEGHVESAMKDIRLALIESEVALPVVKELIDNTKEQLIGQSVIKSVNPGQMIVKIFHDNIVKILSSPQNQSELTLAKSPSVIMMVGLQGSGKTTSTAKIANLLKQQGKRILLVSLDVYRPAAREQLSILGHSVGVDVYNIDSDDPIKITKSALKHAGKDFDVILFDTAGRLHVDEDMMDELEKVKDITNPEEVFLVTDSLTGQDAINIAESFNNKLSITGAILTRIDSDARGGAALSIQYITKKPIKFLCSGEKISDIEKFDPKRIADRILDMGDIVSFVEKASQIIDEKEAEDAIKKMQSGEFNFQDYLSQIKSIKKFGGIGSIMNMLPQIGKDKEIDNSHIKQHEAIIFSMTNEERKWPNTLNKSRMRRISKGAGVSVRDVEKLIKHFEKMKKMMKRASQMDMDSLPGLKNMFF